MDWSQIGRSFEELKKILRLKNNLKNFLYVVNSPSMFPDKKRKKKSVRIKDNLRWFIKNKEVNWFYNSYGLDIDGWHDPEQYLPYREFRIQRDRDNMRLLSSYDYNRVCILRDKVTFWSFFSSVLEKNKVVPVLGILESDGSLIWYGNTTVNTFEQCLQEDGSYFVKKINGECGDGVYKIIHSGTAWKVNGENVDLESWLEKLKGSKYLIQKAIVQHDQLNKIYAGCVNTIRIVTIMGSDGIPRVFAHFLRVGSGGTIVDNRATGGFAIRIDEDGSLVGNGIGHKYCASVHPDTGVRFEGQKIPFFEEVKQLVIKAHMNIRDIKSIGWDVAVTPDGPVLLEGNDNWELCGPQDTCGGLKEKWAILNQ